MDIYAEENDQLRSTVADLEEQISRLKTDLDNLQTIRQWEETDEAGELEPDSEEAPSTVGEALELATARFSDQISFGDCVHDSVSDLAADAGPPPKVLRYLSGLNELALELRQGPLGKDAIQWLRERGFNSSGESESIKNRGGHKWPVEGRMETFEHHLKPSDGTSPDRCVRIYFKWDPETAKMLVGWLGRHPD